MPKSEKRYPMGEPLNLSDEELDAMAFNASPEVVLQAQQQLADDDAQAGRFGAAQEQDDTP